jgi:hypothetical protein
MNAVKGAVSPTITNYYASPLLDEDEETFIKDFE